MRICGHAIAVNPESSLEQFAKRTTGKLFIGLREFKYSGMPR